MKLNICIMVVILFGLFGNGLWAQDGPLFSYDFEGETVLKSWKGAQGSSLQRTSNTKEGLFALEWQAPKGSRIGFSELPKTDWTHGTGIEFWICQEDSAPRTLEIQLRTNARSMFWRKILLQEAGWKKFSIPFYQFARKNGPFWKEIHGIVFYTRDEGIFFLDQLEVSTQKTPELGKIEPDDLLQKRAFPDDKNVRLFKNDYFRIMTNTDINGEKLLTRCLDLYGKFKTRLALSTELEVPLTLLIFQQRDLYVQFCGDTTQHIYGLNLSPTTSDGRTFFDYCVSSYSEKFREDRPVYFHELTHQMISKYLGFDVDQYWIQEGLATLLQLEMMPDGPQIRQDASKMDILKNRVPLHNLEVQYLPPPREYLQMMTVVEFLMKGEYAPKWKEFLKSFSTGTSLEQAVQQVLKMDLQTFEMKWLGFCKSEYSR